MLILCLFYGKLIMGMCVQNIEKALILLAVLAVLGGCGVMDTILPSTGTYRVNAMVNDLPLDEFSFISSNDKIHPYFEDAVSGDPDVTALMVFLKNSRGEVAGWKVIYTLDPENDIEDNTENNLEREIEQTDFQADSRNIQEDIPSEDFHDDDENLDADDAEDEDEDNNDESKIENAGEDSSDDLPVVVVEIPQDIKLFNDSDEWIITVKNLDDDLPYFPIPSDLPMGRYTLVSQVMSGNQILHKTEKSFFFLSNVNFSFESIQVNQPGITASSQLIPKGTVIMLEAVLNFDSRLNPYIVWYNGKKIISEGSFSEGAGNLLWKAPEQTGFFSIRAEAFPVASHQGLAGYVKDISLLVSSKNSDIHLISEDNADLLYWYIFEGNLNDSKRKASSERALRPAGNISPRWMPASGTYGLAAGPDIVYTFPRFAFSNNGNENWRILSRFKPLNDGVILSVQFGPSFDVMINLSVEENNLILALTSPLETVSETFDLSEAEPFVIAEITFSVLSNRLRAKLNVIGDFLDQDEPAAKPVSIEAELDDEYRIILGSNVINNTPVRSGGTTLRNSVFTALWDELALYYVPPMEIEDAEEEQPEDETPLKVEAVKAEEPAQAAEPQEAQEAEETTEVEEVADIEPSGEDRSPEGEEQPESDTDSGLEN